MNSPRLEIGTAARIIGIAVTLAVALGAAPQARATEATPAQTDAAVFGRGAGTWANNCVRCHNARDPKDFRDDQWKIIMSHMRIRAGLTGQEARDVLKFLQGSNGRTTMSAPGVTPVTGTSPAVGSGAGSSGKALFEGTCIACHGAGGAGAIPGVPNLTQANGRLAQPDSVLGKHILEGFQSPGSPMAMPPKGGNPSLTEQDVARLLAYMRATFKPQP